MKKSLFLLSVAFCVVLLSSTAFAGRAMQLSNKSIEGTYAFTGTSLGGLYPGAAVGAEEYDGNGNVEGRMKMNVPDGMGGRATLELVFDGEYNVEPDGMGTETVQAYLTNGGAMANGEPIQMSLFFVITKRLFNKAIEIVFFSDELDDYTGGLVTFVATKR